MLTMVQQVSPMVRYFVFTERHFRIHLRSMQVLKDFVFKVIMSELDTMHSPKF